MKLKTISANRVYQKIFAFCIVIFWLIIFYQKFDLPNKIGHRPTGEHIWAQIDRASMALTYYKDKAPFFLPRCHRATNNPEGITAGEFPLIPYSVSKLYAAFGFNELYHRLFVLTISIIGFIFCFLLATKLLDSYFWAAFSSVIWIVSPNIIYYSISFLPEVPVLAFSIVSIYFLFRNKTGPNWMDLVFYSLFFSLAGLVRVSAILPISAITLAYFIAYRSTKLKGFRIKIQSVIAYCIPLILAVSWLYYAKWILNTYHIHTFLMNPVPPLSLADLKEGLWQWVARNDLFYINGFYYFIGIGTVIGLIFIKRSNKFLLLATCFVYLSFLFTLFVLFKQGIFHSYYWIPFQIGLFFHVAWLANLASQIKVKTPIKIIVFAACMIFVNYNAIHIEKNVKNRWTFQRELYVPYYDMEHYLDSIHVDYRSRVITYSDPTFNNTLYLMDRKGWALGKEESTERLHRAFGSCDYAILNDTNLIQNPTVMPYIGNQIGLHNGIYIYKIRSKNEVEQAD